MGKRFDLSVTVEVEDDWDDAVDSMMKACWSDGDEDICRGDAEHYLLQNIVCGDGAFYKKAKVKITDTQDGRYGGGWF